MMTKSLDGLRIAKFAALVVALMATTFVGKANAQHPTSNTWTAAGTKIKNKATASYTDARGNTYADVADSVEVTVGFRGSVAVTAGAPSASFAAGSTANTVTYTVTNFGNGTDSVHFAFANTRSSTFTGAQYCVGATCFATLAGIDTINIASGASMTVTVKFNVAAGSGGDTASLKLTGDSRGDATDTADSDLTAVSVSLTGSVAVSAASGGTASVVPTNYNGTTRPYYTASFTVANNQSGPVTYGLTAGITGDADIEIIRLTKCSDTTTPVTSVAISYSGSASICVVYNVKSSASAADAATISLGADDGASASDGATYAITVIKASLTISKKAFLANGTTEITTETPKPGDYIWYEITVTNASGAAQASSVVIDDDLPSQVTFDAADAAATSADGGTPTWDFTGTSSTHVTATITTLAANTSRSFKIKVLIK